MSILHMALFKINNTEKRLQLKELFDFHYPQLLGPYDILHYSFNAHNDTLEHPDLKFPGCLLMVEFKKAEDYLAYLSDQNNKNRVLFQRILEENRLVNFPDDIQVFGVNNFKELANYSIAI